MRLSNNEQSTVSKAVSRIFDLEPRELDRVVRSNEVASIIDMFGGNDLFYDLCVKYTEIYLEAMLEIDDILKHKHAFDLDKEVISAYIMRALGAAVGAAAYDQEFERDLNDREARFARDCSEKAIAEAEDVADGKEPSRRMEDTHLEWLRKANLLDDLEGRRRESRRDRGRDRDNDRGSRGRRNDRGRDSDRNRRGDRRDNDRNRSSNRRLGRGNEAVDGKTPATKYRISDRKGNNNSRNKSNDELPLADHVDDITPELYEEIRQDVLAEKKVNDSKAFNWNSDRNTRAGTLDGEDAAAVGPLSDLIVCNGAYETKDRKVESYLEHELRGNSLIGNSKGKVVPRVDFTKLPTNISDDEIVSRSLNGKTENVTYLVGTTVTTHQYSYIPFPANNCISESEFTVQPITNQVKLSLSKDIDIDVTAKLTTFDDIFAFMDKASDAIESIRTQNGNSEVVNTATYVLGTVSNLLTTAYNTYLSLVIPKRCSVSNFYSDYKDAMAALPNMDGFGQYKAHMAQFIAANVDISLSKDDKGDTVITITRKAIAVRTTGDLDTAIRFTDDGVLANIDYKTSPDFYTACKAIAGYRDQQQPWSVIVIADVYGTNINVLCASNGASRIRAERFSFK